MRTRAAIVTAALLLFAPEARAETVIEAFGSATIAANDLAAVRTRALDDAFRQAVDQAIVSLVDPAAREAHADLIKKRVLRRSRVYVTKYKLREESQDEGIYHVHLDATVATETLASDLTALGIPIIDENPDPDPEPDPRPRAGSARPRILLLVVTDDGARVRATFGKGDPAAELDPAVQAIDRALTGRGFQVLTAHGLELPVRAGGEPHEGLPLTDEQALLLARQVGAGGAIVVGIRMRPAGRIRGARLVGAEADGAVRVLDLTQSAPASLYDGRATHAGFGADPATAADAAGAAAAEKLGDPAANRLRTRWPERAGVAGGIAVRVRGAERWPDVAELVKSASAIPGVKQVSAIRFARGEVVLAVLGGASARSVVEALDAVQIPGFRIAARLVDAGEVSVELTGGRPTIPETK